MKAKEIYERLMKAFGLTPKALETAAQLGNKTVASSIERDGNISQRTIDKLLKAFPNVNSNWIFTGEGNMFIGDGAAELENKVSVAIQKERDADDYKDKYIALLEKNQKSAEIAMEMLKSIADSHTALVSMLKPIAESQSMITGFMHEMKEVHRESMVKLYRNMHNIKGSLTTFSLDLGASAERDKDLLISVESSAEYTRRYISHKENIGVKEAAEKYSEIVRENRRLTESGS